MEVVFLPETSVFIDIHGVISQKIEIFIDSCVRTTIPKYLFVIYLVMLSGTQTM
jgi:hypothetical protein